jgi:N4-gp56 family major capsid protein
MANKTARGSAQSSPDAFGNVDLLNTNTNYASSANNGGDTIFASGDLRTRLWSELVTRDAREKNVFSKFIGSEGSGSPVVEKRDLSAGGSDKVTFTTVAPIRGQGVRGEEILKNSTGKLKFGAFSVEVDLIRHAVAWTQVVKLMRFTGKTIDQLSAEVMAEWAGRTEQDHIQMVLRDTCLNNSTSNVISGYGAGPNLQYDEGLSTDIIQEAKQALIARGGEPMNVGGDDKTEIPGYLFFAPDACLRPLRSDPDYLEAILSADERSSSNKLYSGNYAMWDGNIIANHNVLIDTADGRQGSPLLPTALLTAELSPAAEGDLVLGNDTFANFLGFDARIPGSGGSQYEVSDPGYFLIVAPDGSYSCFQYTTNSGGALETLTYNDISAGQGENQVDDETAFPAGSMVYQCNVAGTPIGYALAMGKTAMYYAKGAVSNEQIFHYDDFANSGNEAHLSAVGIQSVYGMAAYQDTNGRIPGVQLVEAVRQIPGFSY